MTPARPAGRARPVVAVGGGHGLARALAALRLLDVAPTAVVTVADDGGSSGRLRRDLGILAPGDLRMALLALARNVELADACAHRFSRGELAGHPLGNLLLVALAERSGGDFVAALDAAGRLLDCAGRVLPSTTEPVHLRARVAGRDVGGQVAVATADRPIERMWLDPPAPAACAEAVAAVGAAELVVLGPGSLFTSVLANLLVPDFGAAVAGSGARIVCVANLGSQPGETAELDLDAHLETLRRHVPGLRLDVVVVHDGPVPDTGGRRLGPTLRRAGAGRVVGADLAARNGGGAVTWAHDPERLAAALAPLLPATAASTS